MAKRGKASPTSADEAASTLLPIVALPLQGLWSEDPAAHSLSLPWFLPLSVKFVLWP